MMNKRIRNMLLAMTLLAWASPALAGGTRAPETTIDQSADGSTVALCQGQRLNVSLPGNPTTGYLWEVVPGDKSVLAPLGEARFEPGGSALGAGGVYHFAFKAVAPGSASLQLIYHRPFEKDTPPARTFAATITVAK